jgi:hypothetical protein
MVGISHRIARTTSELNPKLIFPLREDQLLHFKVLCELHVLYPQAGLGGSASMLANRQALSDMHTRQVWDDKMFDALLVVTSATLLLTPGALEIGDLINEQNSTSIVHIFPIGKWAYSIQDGQVP